MTSPRPVALIAILALLAGACGGGGVPSTSASGAAGPGTSGTGFGGPEIQAQLVAAGMSPGDAAFLAATTTEVAVTGATSAKVTEHLASTDTVTFDVHIQAATGDGELGPSVQTTATPGGFEVHLSYLVLAEDLPDDVRQLFESAAGAGRPVAALAAGPMTAANSAFQVFVDWAIQKGVDTMRDDAIKAIVEKLAPEDASIIVKLIKAGWTIQKGVSLGAELDAQLAELDALENCAKNPTNPLTQQLYKDDPSARDRALADIAAARSELIANTLVSQLGELNKFVAGFGPKWLGYAIGPGTAWAKDTLKNINKELVEQLKRSIPKCTCGAGAASGGSGGSSGGSSSGGSTGGSTSGSSGGTSGGSQSCEFPFTYTGKVDHIVEQEGKIVFQASAADVKWQFDPDQSEPAESVYKLVAGTVTWHYDLQQPAEGCGVDTWKGGGTELLVPDEAPNLSIEGGPGDITEMAQLAISWISGDDPLNNPVHDYTMTGIARLHDKIVLTYCGGPSQNVDPDFTNHLPHWIEVWGPSSPIVGQDNWLKGTATEDVGLVKETWTWEFIPNLH